MEVRLLQHDLDAAGTLNQSIRLVIDGNPGLRDSIFGLQHLLTHVRWLYAVGAVREGLSILQDSVARMERMGDRRVISRAKLLYAEGHGRTGQPAEGVSIVMEVLNSKPQPPIEIAAEASRVMGGLLASKERSYALHYYCRAEQAFRAIGRNALAEATEFERRETISAHPPAPDPGPGIDTLWSEEVAALMSSGGHALLLGAQTKALIENSGIAEHVRVQQSNSQTPGSKGLTIPLGSHLNRAFELRVESKAGISCVATLQAIARIVRSSIELANARAAEREQAFWPAQSIEQHLDLICSSQRMLDLVAAVRRAAATTVTVLLTGETGVGKELFAKALHRASARSQHTFLPFNCSTVPREMIDSQLFGHKRGAFTGAIGDSAGVIRAAAGGTLFLDEIGEMPLESQPKLLRFLESGEILPLGETRPQHVDVRVVAATNANLDQLVAEGRFREDLYYRLNVIRLNIPPLRERREEIPALVEHFLEQFGSELHKPMLRIADETLEYLVLYRWPGNVRQLANEIRRLVAMAEPGTVIMPAHLSEDIAQSSRTVPAHRSPRLFDEVVTRIDQPLSAAVEHVERAAIQRALAMTDGHLDEAARLLGLSRKGLYLKRQRLNLG